MCVASFAIECSAVVEDAMRIPRQLWIGPLSFGLILTAPHVAGAGQAGQVPIPIHGYTGTIALEGTVEQIYSEVGALLVKTGDGVDHLVHVPKGTPVHGSRSLDSLQPGATVVVHYTVKGIQSSADEIDRIAPDGGLKVNEGVVTGVNRAKKRITVKFADGSTQTLRLTRHASEYSGKHARRGSQVVVYYSDDSGQRTAHYFEPRH
jgi:hypothetical protein